MNKYRGMASWLAIVGILIAVRTIWAASQPVVAQVPPKSPSANSVVTPVVGESWLSHLNRPFGDTSMGKTGHLGPPPSSGAELPAGKSQGLVGCSPQTTTLQGADLYRLNCRACHGEAGLGAPPEINSVIDPVRATSVPLVLERMKKMGIDMSRAQATQLAQQAQAALVQRLHVGGKRMPPFPQLHEAEIRSILAYLRQLAGIPGAENEQTAVNESAVRVGELIVKSTCHICHDAAGPNPSPEQLLAGAIPPLGALSSRKNESGLVQKVTQGAPVFMGAPLLLCRGRMPVFYYLNPEEAADAYLYLTLYPPSELSVLDTVAATVKPLLPPQPYPAENVRGADTRPNNTLTEVPQPSSRSEVPYVALFFGVGSFVAILLVGGVGFTFWEFQRLSARNRQRVPSVPNPWRDSDTVELSVGMKQASCRAISGWGGERRRPERLSNEAGDLARKNTRGERQCHGTRSS
jgi:mono/diheme cytochrome c family protein/nitrate reductase NapE component